MSGWLGWTARLVTRSYVLLGMLLNLFFIADLMVIRLLGMLLMQHLGLPVHSRGLPHILHIGLVAMPVMPVLLKVSL